MIRYRHAVLPVMSAVAGCSGPSSSSMGANQAAVELPAASPSPIAATPARPASSVSPRRFVGRWIGVEGMFLDVKQDRAGGLTIENQWDLDHHGRFSGTATADALSWTRGGETITARPSDGDGTGLKWLAGKRDCLTVTTGEGYCRS